MKSILLIKKLLRLVEVTPGLVNASFSLPKWQAVKMIFFAPCGGPLIVARGNSRPPALNDSPARRQLKLWSDGENGDRLGRDTLFFLWLHIHFGWVNPTSSVRKHHAGG